MNFDMAWFDLDASQLSRFVIQLARAMGELGSKGHRSHALRAARR